VKEDLTKPYLNETPRPVPGRNQRRQANHMSLLDTIMELTTETSEITSRACRFHFSSVSRPTMVRASFE